MEILDWYKVLELPDRVSGKAALTIGVFDGLHRGHQQLFRNVLDKKSSGLIPTVVTFTVNPARIFHNPKFKGDLFTLEQKLEQIANMGIERVVLIDFSPEFSKLTGNEFFDSLSRKLQFQYFSVGQNFRCGHKGHMTFVEIAEYLDNKGIMHDIIPQLESDGDRVSSTRIRNAVSSGRMADAASLLNKPYYLDIPENQIGSQNDVSIGVLKQVTPAAGTYKIHLKSEDRLVESILKVHDHKIAWESHAFVPKRIIFDIFDR